MINGCPGAAGIRGAQTIKVKQCPQCGAEIEIFSADVKTPCTECGFIAYNDALSCVMWCKYAKQCVGETAYRQFMERALPDGQAPDHPEAG